MKSLDAKTEGNSKHKNQATYVLCTLFWLITILVLAILYFALFKPKEPDVEVQTIEVSYMYMDGEYPHISALNLSLNILVLLNNPKRAVFHYSFSTAFLYHNGAQLGYSPIPGGHVDEQEAINLTVDLAPQALSLLQGPYIHADVASGELTLATAVVISGHVSVLGIFPHHATSASNCTLVISLPQAGRLQSFSCVNNIALD
ncbi:hypothetical protein L7F22_007684 [Adiantum nelumboides]|nr:hypothetical protein [Adiantum nelumboides]